uniref:Uncharacterized protein n=1 Tax=Arundo donax TaxID=35708 RepID=A0A0A9B266_ARUDO
MFAGVPELSQAINDMEVRAHMLLLRFGLMANIGYFGYISFVFYGSEKA